MSNVTIDKLAMKHVEADDMPDRDEAYTKIKYKVMDPVETIAVADSDDGIWTLADLDHNGVVARVDEIGAKIYLEIEAGADVDLVETTQLSNVDVGDLIWITNADVNQIVLKSRTEDGVYRDQDVKSDRYRIQPSNPDDDELDHIAVEDVDEVKHKIEEITEHVRLATAEELVDRIEYLKENEEDIMEASQNRAQQGNATLTGIAVFILGTVMGILAIVLMVYMYMLSMVM